VAYIFTLNPDDKSSTASVISAAGLATDNGTRGFGLAGEFYPNGGNYRIATAFLRGNLNYSLYGLGSGSSQSKISLNQTGQLYFGEFLRRLGWGFFVGPRFIRGTSFITSKASESGTPPLPAEVGLQTSLTSLGFRVNRDSRPNRFYPEGGTLFDFTADFFSQSLGSKYSFQSYKGTFSKYGKLRDKHVVAYNLFVCVTTGEPPFYGNCVYGMNNQLRGYTAGRYLDRYMVTTQLEYRLSLPMRLGIAAFGGLGEVVPGGNQPFGTANFLPSFGGGPRFELSSKYHVNLRADIAQGRGSHTWSMGIGEAF
jgi:outer membrane protein assembly factor BamA